MNRALSVLLLVCGTFGARAQENALTYTAAQAERGRTAYMDEGCVACHGENLNDGALGAPLKGPPFIQKYGGKTADTLYLVASTTMPQMAPGSLPAATYSDLVAYILQQNDIVPGEQELPTSLGQLAKMLIPAGGFSIMTFSPYVAKPAASKSNALDRWSPVTDALLTNPPPQDWLAWRRTYDAHGFSPLKQIDKKNVGRLRVAWTWSLPPGSNESVPLVHDGVLFAFAFGDKLQALDARTGDLLWTYSHQLEQGAAPNHKRGIALYGDKVYMGTSDAHVIAVSAKTGQLVWDTEIADFKRRESVSAGPLVARGLVMIGTTGTGVGAALGGPQIVGLDAETGAVEWRVHTIAQPGTPGGDSWNGVPVERRSGASVWNTGSYDPALGLAYFGTGNTYDTGPLLPPSTAAGVTNSALYTNSTIAIEPDTGAVKWAHQHMPNDQLDLDWAFERQLVRLPVFGAPRTVAITSGKLGIYEAVDAETGEFVFAYDMGLQNVVTAIDPETGAKTINPDTIPGDGKIKLVCPHGAGAKSFLPASYNAATQVLVVPLDEACMDVFPIPGGGGGGALSSGVNWGIRPVPGGDNKVGRLQAINLAKREIVWTVRQRAPQTSGVLATAGGVVFAGSFDRYLRAYDDANGAILWEQRLNDVSSSSPMTYAIGDKQYLAIVTGQGGFHAASYAALVPELKSPTDRGAAIWVFELPEQ
ncbi:MAG TPA: PQQ-binding-like beta-propeller repeat protein [Gammaproteobacteria bacterium]|nr:PQQ-binding-like beta-propeller repeat protein [Gammaproteobacteria bacterium]